MGTASYRACHSSTGRRTGDSWSLWAEDTSALAYSSVARPEVECWCCPWPRGWGGPQFSLRGRMTSIITGLTRAHSGTTGLKVPFRDVPQRLKKKTKGPPTSWFTQGLTPDPGSCPRTHRRTPGTALKTERPHCWGWGRVGAGRKPTRVRQPSPGQVLRHSPQGLLLLGPVLGSSLVGHLQPQPLPAAWLQDLQSRCVGAH